MRVIETVRTSQCPRCGKPPTRCRCDLKKSIRQRTKCSFSYIFPKATDTEKESSNEAPSPFQLIIQNPLPEITIDDNALLAEKNIICPRCLINLERSRISPEVGPICDTVCQHCMLRAQIYKHKAEKRKSRLRSHDDHYERKYTAKDEKVEIIYMSKKYHTALTESKPSLEEHDAALERTPKETELDVSGKLHKFKYSPTEINTLRPKSMPIDLTKMQNMFQYEMSFLTYKEDNEQMKPTDVENKIEINTFIAEPKVSKASAFPSASTISNLKELQQDYFRPQLADICKTDQVIQTAEDKFKKPDTVLRDDKLKASSSQEIMSYRFPNTFKNITVYKQTTSSALIKRTRDKLLDREQQRKQKEIQKIFAKKKEKRLKELVDLTMKQKCTPVEKQEQKVKVKKEELSDIPKEKDQKREKEKEKKNLEIGEISKKHKQIEDDKVNKDKRQKEKGMPGIQKQNREEENETSKQKKEEAEKRKEKEKEEAEKKKKNEQEAAEKKKKNDEEAVRNKKKEEEIAEKNRKEYESTAKNKKSEADSKKIKEDMEELKKQKGEEERQNKEQQKISNKKQEPETAKIEKEPTQVANLKIIEETAELKMKKGAKEAEKKESTKKKKDEVEKKDVKKKDKPGENEKPSREKRLLQSESELIIFKLIREHKVKRAEERMLHAEQNIIADKQKLTEMSKKKIEADKKKQEAEQAEKTRQIEATFKKRTQENILAASSVVIEVRGPKHSKLDKVVKIRKSKITDIIIGDSICQSKLPLPQDPLQDLDGSITPLLFKKKSVFSEHLDVFSEDDIKQDEKKYKDALTGDKKATKDGIFRYALSNRSFIENGWTVLPVEEVVRKMNVYRMRPAQPEFDWFERNRNKRHLQYSTGEKLAVFDDQGGCRWYYKNGRLALDYYNSEELNSQHRYVVYSNGEPDERGRSRPYTVLATFSHLGTGVVFDHGGKIRYIDVY